MTNEKKQGETPTPEAQEAPVADPKVVVAALKKAGIKIRVPAKKDGKPYDAAPAADHILNTKINDDGTLTVVTIDGQKHLLEAK